LSIATFTNTTNSASAPTTASIVSLVNDALLAAGKPVLGFLNPWLYSVGSAAFTDIVDGSSLGCGTDGFPAQTGWDAVTGFGTPVSISSSLLIPASPSPASQETVRTSLTQQFFPKFQAAALNNGIW
jgi:hypothetical protein